jgi:MOSC domain-containing protein YiiM
MARRLNLDDDGQGDLGCHGGEQRAVFVYQTDDITTGNVFTDVKT